MLFHTWIFILFFLIVYPVYLLVRKTRFKDIWLLIASYVFYGWWNPLYLLLIVYSTAIDYVAVIRMDRSRRKKLWLYGSVINNLALLGLFKYAGFITDNLNYLLAQMGLHYAIPAPGVLLPVGISFYTFQSMSYTIDFYRGQIKKEPNFIRFATFVSLFPQLVAGPIERAKNLLPQIQKPSHISRLDITDGLSLFVVGLFKKLAMADFLSQWVDPVYASPGSYQAPALLFATFAFAWQIYFDFSGYTDMARGIARLMGFRLMLNFNNPYLATGLGDFWARWHISLSTWFRDYVYIPLGGNRKGTFSTYRNIFLTMVISGFWHGAAWTMIIWGALHATGVMLTRQLERSAIYRERVPRFAKQMWVFIFVFFTWIFFRAGSLGDAWLILNRIFASGFADPGFPLLALGLVLIIWAYQFMYDSRIKWLLSLAPVRVSMVVAMILYIIIFSGGTEQPFIYFQF
jgi:D-alanyl-lipoteichoic acid acyltransferase DltB (MBOAT superfamily)